MQSDQHSQGTTRYAVDPRMVDGLEGQFVWTSLVVDRDIRLHACPDSASVIEESLLHRGPTCVEFHARFNPSTRTLWIDQLARGLIAPNQRFTQRTLEQVLALIGPCSRIDLYNITNRAATEAFLRAGNEGQVKPDGPLLQALVHLGFVNLTAYMEGTAYRCIAATRQLTSSALD